MRKLINEPSAFVDEMLEGLVLAHPERIRRLAEEPRALFGRRATFWEE